MQRELANNSRKAEGASSSTLSPHYSTNRHSQDSRKMDSLEEDIKKMSEDLNEFVSLFYQDSTSKYADTEDKPDYSSVLLENEEFSKENLPDDSFYVSSWLTDLKKEIYAPDFLFNGYDNIHFIKDILKIEDFDSLGIYDDKDVQFIYEKIDDLPDPPKITLTSSQEFDITYLLDLCKLEMYYDNFVEHSIESFEKISTLTNMSLILILNIQQIGYRHRLMYYIEQALDLFHNLPAKALEKEKENEKESSSTLDMVSSEESSKEASSEILFNEADILPAGDTQQVGEFVEDLDHFLKKQASVDLPTDKSEIDHDHSKPVETLKSHKASGGKRVSVVLKKLFAPTGKLISRGTSVNHLKDSSTDSNLPRHSLASAAKQGGSEKDLSIRKSVVDFPSEKISWIHTEAQLLSTYISIDTHFLGMVSVKDIQFKGRRVVQECIDTLKNISMHNRKMPVVIVNINARCILLMNGDTKSSICSHNMDLIFFCAQDTSDQRVFAYIYLDDMSKSFLCNAFRCNSVKTSTEAVLAIGLAFDMGYRKMKRIETDHFNF